MNYVITCIINYILYLTNVHVQFNNLYFILFDILINI